MTVTSLIGIVMLVEQRIFDAGSARLSLWMAPAYYAGLVAGTGCFRVSTKRAFADSRSRF